MKNLHALDSNEPISDLLKDVEYTSELPASFYLKQSISDIEKARLG